MSRRRYNLVSFSGGKDSTAMLLRLIDEGVQIDCILFCDTGLEFPEMYEHVDKVERDIGMPITRVHPETTFEYAMLEEKITRRPDSSVTEKYGDNLNGFGWPGPKMRWCTSRLKDEPRERFLKDIRKQYDVYEYVGIAADEMFRLERKQNQNPNHVHPLVDWNMTEQDCLDYCYSRGYDWGGLYRKFKRASCWCCPLQSLEELRKLYTFYPDLWETLKEWDRRAWRKFRADYSVDELETRFLYEEKCRSAGTQIRGRDFFRDLREWPALMELERNSEKMGIRVVKDFELVPVDKLVPYINNARTHSPAQISKLRSSIREFGFIAPLVIDRDFNVLAGHGRLEAAKAEEYTEVPCVYADNLTEAQKKAYILADNRMAMDAGWDEELLRIEIAELQATDFNALLTGFREDEIKDLFSVKMTPDDVGSNTEFDEDDFGDGEFAHECPRCGFRYN